MSRWATSRRLPSNIPKPPPTSAPSPSPPSRRLEAIGPPSRDLGRGENLNLPPPNAKFASHLLDLKGQQRMQTLKQQSSSSNARAESLICGAQQPHRETQAQWGPTGASSTLVF